MKSFFEELCRGEGFDVAGALAMARDGAGNTLAGFLRQLDGIARDFGFQTFKRVLDDQDTFPTPLEKFRPWFDHINSICQGRVLLILDNLELALDGEGRFRDPELGAWFLELLARSPGWKALVTCRRQFAFYTLGFCAQALCEMHHFIAAKGILANLLLNERLPEQLRGKVLLTLGTLLLEQRDWPQALVSYQKALEWNEKTDQHHQLGSTWHQIGRVYQEQGDFAAALRNYLQALALFSEMKWAKEAAIAFGSIGRIFPHLSSQEKESIKEALPEEMYRLLEEEENTLS